MRTSSQAAALAVALVAALAAVPGAAQSTNGTAQGQVAYFTIRSQAYPNGNDAPTPTTVETAIRADLQQLLDPTQTNTVQIRINETSSRAECDVVTQQCHQIMTFYFVGAEGSRWATELSGVDTETAARTLEVTTFARGTTVPPVSLSSEQTLTKFLVTVLAGYFGASLFLLIVFCVVRKKILDAEDDD